LPKIQEFIFRYAIVAKETWPNWSGDPKKGIEIIMQRVNMDKAQYELGKTKIFIKAPESVKAFFISFRNNYQFPVLAISVGRSEGAKVQHVRPSDTKSIQEIFCSKTSAKTERGSEQ